MSDQGLFKPQNMVYLGIYMNKLLFTLMLLGFSSLSYADIYTWTNGNPDGPGISVTQVYPNFTAKKIVFKSSDNKSYSYQWDINSSDMTSNANSVLSILLTALAADKKVSLYYNLDESKLDFTQIRLNQ